jgi:nickel-dependent lactate racemase
MQIRLAYGKTGIALELPDERGITILEPDYVPGLPDPQSSLREALQHPQDLPPLSEWVKTGRKVGIAFSDITRPTPNHLLLPAILSELSRIPEREILLFNGTGTHRPNTDEELRQMLGDGIVSRFRIVQNDALDRESHIQVGTTSSGNDIWIHRDFVECDARILTGFIEPHFFAGFSGGGKACMPGLALLDTIYRNHSAANLDNPSTTWGVTEGNPLWEEVQEAAAMLAPVFLLNVSLNRDKQITGVFAGRMDEAHRAGCAFVKEKAMTPVAEPFDIVITSNSGFPLDLNLYQSVKGMSAAAQIVKPGGAIIIAADCWDGIPDHGEYGKMLREADTLDSLLDTIRKPGYRRQDMWQAHVQALICRKAEVYVYSGNLTDQQIRDAFLHPCRDIEGLAAQLLERYGPEARICVLPEGPQTIPYLREPSHG